MNSMTIFCLDIHDPYDRFHCISSLQFIFVKPKSLRQQNISTEIKSSFGNRHNTVKFLKIWPCFTDHSDIYLIRQSSGHSSSPLGLLEASPTSVLIKVRPLSTNSVKPASVSSCTYTALTKPSKGCQLQGPALHTNL